MAKDDYDVMAYRILVYLYAIFKCKTVFNEETFKKVSRYYDVSEVYFERVLQMMQREGLIENIIYVNNIDGIPERVTPFEKISITANGIHYLLDNDKMKKIKNERLGTVEFITSFISLIG